jgi:hypothetical protein
MKIENFTFQEAIYSKTAEERNINNVPKDFEIIENILYTASCMQKLRDMLEQPIIITSWYRSWLLNDFIRGSETSQHPQGKAVDFVCPAFGSCKEVYEAIKHSDIVFDQLILETKKKKNKIIEWIHISFNPGKDRRECLDLST